MHSKRPPKFPIATGEWATAKRIPCHIWELDGCENKNGWRMKENMNEIGLQLLNCVWDGLHEAKCTHKRRS